MESNIALLRLIGLPVFSTIVELAEIMHVTPGVIRQHREQPRASYNRFTIPKSDGTRRQIKAPVKELKGIQAWILRNILDRLATSPYATAYTDKRRLIDNVLPHRNNRYYICIDLKDFFPSISTRRVVILFSNLGYSAQASEILARLCTFDGNLPQGAVTSPRISNLIAAKLDRRIAGYTSKRNIIYTRYSDDITLSSNNRSNLHQSLSRITKIIKTEHFQINDDKLRILGPRTRVVVTGLIKNNSEAKFGIGRMKKRIMRAVIHHYFSGKSKDSKYNTEESIIGWIAYLKSVDTDSYKYITDFFSKMKPLP